MSQLNLDDYAVQPASRRSDPTTSVEAGLRGDRARSKRAVLRTLAEHGPMHDEKLADLLSHLPRGSAGKRRYDLVKMKLVEQVTLHGEPVLAKTRADSNALVWGLTARGRFVAERLPVDDTPTPPADPQPAPVCAEPGQTIELCDLIDEMLGRLHDRSINFDVAYDVIATAVNDLRRAHGQEPT